MRAFRSTLLLVVVFAGLLGYLYFVDSKTPLTDSAAVKPKVFTVEANNIEEIRIRSASGEATALRKTSDTWNIVEPVQVAADEGMAFNIASTLASLEEDRLVEESAADLTPYGLAKPRIEVEFRLAGEKEPRRLLIGEKSATGAGVYAKLANANRVVLIGGAPDVTFDRSLFDLRDKTVLTFARDKVDSLELVSGGSSIHVTRSEPDWRLLKPIAAPADFTTIDGLLGQIQTAQMTGIVAQDATGLGKYGLEKPGVTVVLGSGSARATLQLGGKDPDGSVYARDTSRPLVFKVPSTVADELRKSVFDFRRKDVFQFRPFNATRFDITRGPQTRAFERVKAANADSPDTWRQVAPDARTVDTANLEGVLLQWSNLRAEAFVENAGPATGLTSPAAAIVVRFDDGKVEERVTIGRSGTDVFAARADQPGALKIEAGKFDEALKALDEIK